ncbi:hypothetical protein RI129_009286 [Pyrocoelia pectoralis]|uniref:DNA-directed RNA polymerase III subunit RPC5 n=1 Tax=Pyrocoelia pectoralis TaxID=417401 RepID=A0AAN7VBC6_9COLE
MDEEENSRTKNDIITEDPVIKEIPVFLSKRLQDQLYLFQYPLRPSTNKSLDVKNCFIKPNNETVKLEVQLDTISSSFNIGKAEDVALRVDGPPEYRKKDKDVFFNNNLLDKIEYVSSKVGDNVERYGIGIFDGQEYHITPLKGLLRLKPYYPHLDREAKKKVEAKVKEEPVPSTSTSEPKQVTVKFSQGGDNEKWKKLQENSYKAMMQRQAEEEWIRCDWKPQKSELSDLEKMKLFAEDNRGWVASGEEKDDIVNYLKRLVPEDKEHAICLPSLPSNVVSFSSLRVLPLLEQCKLLLKDAKIVTFQQLMMLLAGCEGLTADSLLKALPQVAVLVRGNWVVKSEIVFPNGTFSSVSGVPADIMCRARDYVLILFTKQQYIERRKVSSVIKVPSEETKEIFMGISKLRYNKRWELTLPIDSEFIKKYPEVVYKQSSMWDMRELQLNNFFQSNKEKKRRKSKSVSEDSAKIPKKDGQTHVRDNHIADGLKSDKVKRTKTVKSNDVNHKDEKS